MVSNSASTKPTQKTTCTAAGKPPRKSALKTCLILAFGLGLSAAVPAEAYNWGYSPFYWGLSSMRYLFPVFGAPYNANPMYSAASIIRTVGRGSVMLPPNRYPYPQQLEQYQDEEPLVDPRDRTRWAKSGPDGVDEISYAGWRPSTNNQQGSVMQPMYPGQLVVPQQQQQQIVPQAAYLAPQQPAYPQQYPQQQPAQPVIGEAVSAKLEPPTAPAFNSNASPYVFAPAPSALPGSPSPLAAAFINHVNTKFRGNISEALFDPETRSWARVLGLVNHDDMFHADLTDDRIMVIGKIFQDPLLDPLSKLDAARILLRKQNESIQIAGKSKSKHKKNN